MIASCEFCGSNFTIRPYQTSTARFCSRSCKASSRTSSKNSNWRGGKTSHPLYGVYNEILHRCTNPNHKRWADYGGRGITVCVRWRDDFWNFVDDMGPRPDGVSEKGRSLWSIDRIDNDGPYSPENCQWSSNIQQRRNRRPQKRRTHCIRGHQFTPMNTQIQSDGSRKCRTCMKARDRARNRTREKDVTP